MNALALALLASVVGVDYGWQINRAGELEYIVQVEPELVARLRDGEKLESEIPANMRNIRRIIVRVGNGPVPRDPLPAQHRATSSAPTTAAPVSHTGARNTAQPATLHQPATAWTQATAPRVLAQASTTTTPGTDGSSALATDFMDGQQYNTNHPLTAAETAAGQIGGTFGGGAFQPAGSATTIPAATPRPTTTAGGFTPGGGFNPGGSFNPGSAPPLTNPATIPPLTGSTPIRPAPPLRNPPLASPATQPGGSAWGGTNPQPAYTPNPSLANPSPANPRTAVPHAPAPSDPAEIPVRKQPELYTPPERPVVAAPAPQPITPIRDVAPPRVAVPRTDPSMVAAGRGALDPSYKPTYPAGGLGGPMVATRPPAVSGTPAGSPVSIPAGTPKTSVPSAGITGAVPASISPEIAKTNPAASKLAELTGEKPWWMLTLIAILLFVSIGMNFYLWWVARGIYNRYRRLTAEIRDGAALL